MRVLQLAVGHAPVRGQELIQRPRPRETPSLPPGTRPASNAPAQTDLGDAPTYTTPVKWRGQTNFMPKSVASYTHGVTVSSRCNLPGVGTASISVCSETASRYAAVTVFSPPLSSVVLLLPPLRLALATEAHVRLGRSVLRQTQ